MPDNEGKKIRMVLVGYGGMGKQYAGMMADGGIEGLTLCGICCRNQEGQQEIRQRYPNVRIYEDTDHMFDHAREFDGILIATPHRTHVALGVRAFRQGLHVLVEKPVGIFADEVAEILPVLAERPELVCGVMYNRRAAQAYRHVKNLVQSGELGELVRCSWIITNLYRTEAYYTSGAWRGTWQGEGGGLLMTQASHQLDLMQWICGMPVSVLARCSTIGRPIQVENEAELFLTYLNGAHGHFIASAHECPGTNLLEICGTRGRISVRDDSEVEIIRLEEDERTFARSCPSPFEQVSGTVERLTFDDRNNKAQQAATIQNFVAAAQGAGPIQCSLEEGLRSLQIIHGAYLSHWMGRTVTLPGDERVFCRILNRTGASMAIGHGPL